MNFSRTEQSDNNLRRLSTNPKLIRLASVLASSTKNFLLNDAEVQPLIAEQTNNFDPYFLYTNYNSLSLEEVQTHFMSLFPSVQVQKHSPMALCGYDDNRAMMPVEKAVCTRKLNLRAIPWGPRPKLTNELLNDGDFWIKSYPELPPMMAFDVDENDKPHFRQLYPDHRCYEIHDALDIPRPLVTTINPISKNCQYIYEMRWTHEDYFNLEKTMIEYERIRRDLSLLFGADPAFVNHVVRSPMFIAGHHRINPNKTTSRKLIDVDRESLWHHSIWYDPHGYTLAELRQIISYLTELHGIDEKEHVATAIKDAQRHQKINDSIVAEMRLQKQRSLPINIQRQLARTPASQIHEGERNVWLFSNLSLHFCRPMATSYRGDPSKFMADALAKATVSNNSLSEPLPGNEITSTVKSIVGWCLSERFRPIGRTSEEATYINRHFRWGVNYVTVAMRARKLGISDRTYYRRQRQQWRDNAEDVVLILDRALFNYPPFGKPSARSYFYNHPPSFPHHKEYSKSLSLIDRDTATSLFDKDTTIGSNWQRAPP